MTARTQTTALLSKNGTASPPCRPAARTRPKSRPRSRTENRKAVVS